MTGEGHSSRLLRETPKFKDFLRGTQSLPLDSHIQCTRSSRNRAGPWPGPPRPPGPHIHPDRPVGSQAPLPRPPLPPALGLLQHSPCPHHLPPSCLTRVGLCAHAAQLTGGGPQVPWRLAHLPSPSSGKSGPAPGDLGRQPPPALSSVSHVLASGPLFSIRRCLTSAHPCSSLPRPHASTPCVRPAPAAAGWASHTPARPAPSVFPRPPPTMRCQARLPTPLLHGLLLETEVNNVQSLGKSSTLRERSRRRRRVLGEAPDT